MRLAGIDFATIGHKPAADPSINTDGVGHPQGYGADIHAAGDPPPDDEQLAELVAADLRRTLKARWRHLDAAELREVQHARLKRPFVVGYEIGRIVGPLLFGHKGRIPRRKYVDRTHVLFGR